MPPSALIIGCGYLGRRVAELWHQAGWQVHAMTRSDARAAEFRRRGWQPIVAEVTEPATLANLPAVDTVLLAVGYDRTSDHSIEQVYAGGVENVLAALPAATKRLIYISTTGVYGDAGGDWVDETTPPSPQRAGGRASLAAEQAILASPFAGLAVTLRLAGIYGPDRLPYLKLLEAGEPIEAPSKGYLNLIHVDDAARVVQAVSDSSYSLAGPTTYCVCDGHPVVRGDYYREAARRLGAPEPRYHPPAAGSPRQARAASNRRISNRKLVEQLGVNLQYADYRAGLAGSQP